MRLQILSINLVCVIWISYHRRILSPICLLYKRPHVNNMIFFIQSGGNRLPERRSLNHHLHLWSHTLWTLSRRSTSLWSKFTSRSSTEEIEVALEEGRLSSQMWLLISVASRSICRKSEGQREFSLVVTHPRIPQTIFHNGSLRILLFQIPKILKQPPWHATTTSTSGAPIYKNGNGTWGFNWNDGHSEWKNNQGKK